MIETMTEAPTTTSVLVTAFEKDALIKISKPMQPGLMTRVFFDLCVIMPGCTYIYGVASLDDTGADSINFSALQSP